MSDTLPLTPRRLLAPAARAAFTAILLAGGCKATEPVEVVPPADTNPRLVLVSGTQVVTAGTRIDPGFTLRVTNASGDLWPEEVQVLAVTFDPAGSISGRTSVTTVGAVATFDSIVPTIVGEFQVHFRVVGSPHELLYLLKSQSSEVVEEPEVDVLDLFRYDAAAPLAYLEAPAPALDATSSMFQVSFASPAGGRVTGVLAVPKSPGPHPGIVVLHGLPSNAMEGMLGMGYAYAQRGAVVLAINAPWVNRTGTLEFTPQDSVDQVQLMKDLQRAVDVLVARADVDVARIAFVGGSYGGAMGAGFIAIESRLAAAALLVPDGGLVAHFTNPGGSPVSNLTLYPAAQQQRWLAAMRPIEPITFVHRTLVPKLLVQNGLLDAAVATDDASALHAALPAHASIRWYNAGHSLNAIATEERHVWMASAIGTSVAPGN
jgi:cephalosporin-C deacetylase-like acetyl esterase